MTPVDTITDKPGKAIKVRNYAAVIAIVPDGKAAYVTSVSNNVHKPGYVTPINTATNTAGRAIEVGIRPGAIAVTPNGKTAYIVSTTGAKVPPFPLDM